MERTIDEAIQAYLARGFGSMTKNDFEVWIFHQMMMNEKYLKDKTNYEISRVLKIPETKVKRLRYEADLKFVNDKEVENERLQKIGNLLGKAKLKSNGTQLQFSVEDPVLRKYIDHRLKEKNTFSDSSFINEIVSLSLDDYEILLEIIDVSGNEKRELLKKARKKFNDKTITLKGVIQKIIDGAAEGTGSLLIEKGWSWIGLTAKLAALLI